MYQSREVAPVCQLMVRVRFRWFAKGGIKKSLQGKKTKGVVLFPIEQWLKWEEMCTKGYLKNFGGLARMNLPRRGMRQEAIFTTVGKR